MQAESSKWLGVTASSICRCGGSDSDSKMTLHLGQSACLLPTGSRVRKTVLHSTALLTDMVPHQNMRKDPQEWLGLDNDERSPPAVAGQCGWCLSMRAWAWLQ